MKNSGPDTVAAVASATMSEVAEARDQYDNAVSAIRRNPLPSIAVAAGIGSSAR
jgi:hypothetical protein